MRADATLVIGAVQIGLVGGTNPVYRLDALLENIATLIAQACMRTTPLISIQDHAVDEIGSPGWQSHPTIAPEAGELVIGKPETDAFSGTTLQQELEARGLGHLIVVF